MARAQTSLLPDVPGYYTRYLENLALNGAANTVTVRFNNYSSGAVDPTSATFRATVTRF